MDKRADIALGCIPTIILIVLLGMLGQYSTTLFVITSIALCLPTGIYLIKKEGYKNIGIGVITGLIAFYLFAAFIYIAMQGPM